MEFFYRITMTCFAASYLVAFGMELTRFMFRIRIRAAVTIAMMVAGLLAHTIYLFAQSRVDLRSGIPLSSWDSWFLVAAWLMAMTYLINLIRHPRTPTGLLLLPIALVLILAAYRVEGIGSFSPAEMRNFWRITHGLSLLAATFTVSIGFVAGVLYLIEARRLKRKKFSVRRFSFPSLEKLQNASERTLIVSTCLQGLGVLSGVVINLSAQTQRDAVIQWTDPVVWSSSLLFLWLVAALVFSWLYKPARYGQKAAYLVVASFLFLIMALTMALFARHGDQSARHPENSTARSFTHVLTTGERG